MENVSSWHFLKKDGFESLNNPGKKPQTLMKNPHPVLAAHKSEKLLFNLPRKQIFGVQTIFPLLDLVCYLAHRLDEV